MMIILPHSPAAFGMPIPVGRRIGEAGKITWIILSVAVAMAMAGVYFYQINAAATKTFVLREQEKRLERLHETVSALEARAAKEQAMTALEERIKNAGFVAGDFVEYVSVESIAVAK